MTLRMHIIGVTLIVIVCLIALVVSGKIRFGEPPPVVATDQNKGFVRIENATWGLSCAKRPGQKATIAEKVTEGETATGTGQPEVPVMPPLRVNNALRIVSSWCNGQTVCNLPVDPPHLGDDPAPSCVKDIVVEYRCIDFGPMKKAEATDGKTLAIDCTDPDRKAPAAGQGPAS